VALLATSNGVMSARELALQLLAARGSVETDEAERRRLATAVLRACVELDWATLHARAARDRLRCS
jgi:hypothetical protein